MRFETAKNESTRQENCKLIYVRCQIGKPAAARNSAVFRRVHGDFPRLFPPLFLAGLQTRLGAVQQREDQLRVRLVRGVLHDGRVVLVLVQMAPPSLLGAVGHQREDEHHNGEEGEGRWEEGVMVEKLNAHVRTGVSGKEGGKRSVS